MKLFYDLSGTQVRIVLHTAETSADITPENTVKEVIFDAANFPAEFRTGDEDTVKTLAGYGLQKLLQDRTSQDKGQEPKFDAMVAEAERLMSGEWRKPTERTGGGGSRTSRIDHFLVSAVAELKSITEAQANAALQKISADERKALAAKPAVAEKIAELREAAKNADASAVDLSDI